MHNIEREESFTVKIKSKATSPAMGIALYSSLDTKCLKYFLNTILIDSLDINTMMPIVVYVCSQ